MKRVFILVFLFFAALSVYSQTESYIICYEADLLLFVNLENNSIKDYKIYTVLPFCNIILNRNNFQLFRDLLNRFLEWEKIAETNNLTERFEREIPITVTSNNVTWSTIERQQGYVTYKMIENEMQIKSTFNWNPTAYNESLKGNLHITSNTITSNTPNSSFYFDRYIMRNDAKQLLENLTDSKIQEAIQRGRAEEQERQRQKQLQEELFR